MDAQKQPKKAVRMFIFWVLSCLVVNGISACRQILQVLSGTIGVGSVEPDWFLFVLLLLIGVYFVPMLFFVCRHAKREQIKWLVITSKVLLIHFVIVEIVAVIIVLIKLFLL